MRNLATTAALPAQEAINAMLSWSRTQWMASRAWRITALSITAFVVLTVCHIVNISHAMADTGSGTNSANTFFLDLANQTDTHGIGVWQYTTLPLDYGQATTPGRMVRGFFLRLSWLLYTLVLFMVLAMVKFILDFTWLEWLLSPVILLTNTIRETFSLAGIMTLGLSVSALVIAFGFIRGRKAAAIVEFVAVVLIFGLASAPAVSNPTQLFEGDGSWIQNSRDYGVEAGNLTSQSDGGPAITGNPISAGIIDQTLRRPTQYIAFGSQLGGECADEFDAKMLDGADAEAVRKAVTGCSSEAKAANETDGWEAMGVMYIFATGTFAIMFLAGVFIVFIVKDATLALLGLVNVVIRAHLAVFPGGGRYAFINALGQMTVNIVMIGLYIWMLSAYLWLVNMISALVPESVLVMGNFIVGIAILTMVYTFFRLKRAGKNVASLIAKALGKTGLSSPPAPRQPSNLAQTIKRTGQRALGTKLGNAGSRRPPLRPPMRFAPVATAAAAAATGNAPGRGPANLARLALAAGAAATTGGTSLALQTASTAASFMGTPNASKETPTQDTNSSKATHGGIAAIAARSESATTTTLAKNAPGTKGIDTTGNRVAGAVSKMDASTQPAGEAPQTPQKPTSGPRHAGTAPKPEGTAPRPAQTPPAPLEGKIVDRVPNDVRRIPVYQAPEKASDSPTAPARAGAGLIRQQPPSMSGIIRG
ncbi:MULTISPECIES: hypothetical protein [Paenarthrobacter]|uniref:TrbL/VirB6 plasmid conjugal transfer protein n=1 Tax=Paenarthrobacter ureafaciens TaxID=37931 RepID=A0AAX3EPQ5_PAEUR|nr:MULTISPECIES: hypothetical protein [Paenarthrobacter]MDO5867074.1 hypothetical protein [Paenarthrobacter sp. SD-2]MDO5878243.1 hypothetical protein [Paenarthrobacter sp. SD-1]UYV95515.1 hypothetical protein NL395_23105 [Paenarthrobacter ureafaciens]UYW00116.1 hypothetical protein NL394_23490 [Paenarthrobacter ureafaciens]